MTLTNNLGLTFSYPNFMSLLNERAAMKKEQLADKLNCHLFPYYLLDNINIRRKNPSQLRDMNKPEEMWNHTESAFLFPEMSNINLTPVH